MDPFVKYTLIWLVVIVYLFMGWHLTEYFADVGSSDATYYYTIRVVNTIFWLPLAIAIAFYYVYFWWRNH
jgi:hypothetical protein